MYIGESINSNVFWGHSADADGADSEFDWGEAKWGS